MVGLAVVAPATGDVVDTRIDARDERQQAYDQQQYEDDDTEHVLIVPDVLHQHKSGFHRFQSVRLINCRRSETFDDARDRLTLPDAHRRDPVAALPAFELVQERRSDARAGGSERVAEGDPSPVRVHVTRLPTLV